MSTKAFKAIKNLSKDELATKIREVEATLFQTRMKKVTGQLENVSLIWQLQKTLARAKTLTTQQATQPKSAVKAAR